MKTELEIKRRVERMADRFDQHMLNGNLSAASFCVEGIAALLWVLLDIDE